MEKLFKFSHSNMKQVFGTVRRTLEPWANRQVHRGYDKYQERIAARDRNVPTEEELLMDFHECTIMIDGIDFRIENPTNTIKEFKDESWRMEII